VSGLERASSVGAPYNDAVPFARKLVTEFGDRCVWGSDWPHPPHNDDQKGANLEAPYRALSYTTLVDEFIAALPSADCAARVMGDNAVRLYDF
jgi:2-pyrone-4,6-dicarboxylate lactonase